METKSKPGALDWILHDADPNTTYMPNNNPAHEAPLPPLPREIPRTKGVCSHTILQKELLLVVPDLLESRFKHYPATQWGFRFYAGTPLVSPEGAHIGSLCILDTRPRTAASFGEEQQEQLVDLAAAVMDLMTERRLSQSSNAQFHPGFTFSYDVQRAATFLRQQIASLKDDSDFQTVTNDQHRWILQSAFDTADFLQASLAPDHRVSATRRHSPEDTTTNTSPDWLTMPPPPNREPSSSSSLGGNAAARIGEHRAMDMEHFVKNLETAMEAFPRKALVSITLHPELPNELMFNDLKVFRSAIALLTSACERTQEGFVRLKIFPKDERQHHPAGQRQLQPVPRSSKVVLFECEDTGRDVDLERFEILFQAPSPDVEDAGYEPVDCIRLETGDGKNSTILCEYNPTQQQQEPISGGFAVHAVAQYMDSIGGKYGFRPRFVQSETGDSSSGSIFWFSIPLQLVPPVSPRSRSSVLDSVIDSALESTPLTDSRNNDSSLHRVDRSANVQRPFF